MTLKFCPNLAFLYGEFQSLLDKYNSVKSCGFDAVEFPFPYSWSVDEVKQVQAQTGIRTVIINTYPGKMEEGELGFAALPGKEKEFQNSINLALLYAKALNCKKIHVMSGAVDAATELNLTQYENNLRHVSKIFENENILGLIEPINPITVPNYFMNSFETALTILDKINSPNLKLQLDLFHLQHLKGNLTRNINNYKAYIGHVQIAQVPSRFGPYTAGEINYRYIFDLLKQLPYDDYIGLEYRPEGSTESSLKWLRDGDGTSR